MKGEVGILNVGAGDTKLSFDPANPTECVRAAKVVTDMLERGYAILVEVGRDDDGEPIYKRAKSFDPKTCEYLIVGVPDEKAAEGPTEAQEPALKAPGVRGRRKSSIERVPAAGTHAVAVSRSAGG